MSAEGDGQPPDPALRDPEHMPSPIWLVPAGALIAALGSMAGIGGGLFVGPLLAIVYRFPLKRAVATALGLVVANSVLSTITEATNPEGRILWSVSAVMAVGSLIGAQIGIHVSRRLDERTLRRVFVVVLGGVGLKILSDAFFDGTVVAEPDVAIGVGGYLIAVVAGFAGGTIAPVLGIGGGLVMVPAVYMLLPGAGFAEARACSLAVIMLTAARGLYLHASDGRVSWRCVPYLALGGAAGGLVGARVIHLPGLDLFGQLVLGAALWITAGRFVFDLRRRSRPSD